MFIEAELSKLPVTDGRAGERRIVNLAAALRETGAKTARIVVIDISQGGFKAEIDEEFDEGSEVWLKVPGFEVKRSRVVWREGKLAGCEFRSPLHQGEIDIITAPKPRKITKGVFGRG